MDETPVSAPVQALRQIVALAREWEANRLGSVHLQRKRWQKLAALTAQALQEHERLGVA